MAKKRTAKKAEIMKQSTEMPVVQMTEPWGEKLVTFFDEFEVGMDGVWYGKEMDLDDFDSYYFMSGYEMLSLFPEIPVVKPGRAETSRALEQIIKTRRTIANFAHLNAASGSFRYALPQEAELGG